MWVVLIILFEVGLGHYVLGGSWGNLLHAYNLLGVRCGTVYPLGRPSIVRYLQDKGLTVGLFTGMPSSSSPLREDVP